MARPALWIVLLGACTGTSPDPGLDAVLQVANAQYRPGPFPADTGGPAALDLVTRHSTITIGELAERATGTLAPGARAAVFGIPGFDGTWLVPAGLPDLTVPDAPTATAVFGVGDEFRAGLFTLLVAASDDEGRFGPAASTEVIAEAAPEPAGELVFALVWDGPADLDLHVVEPGGGEAWSGKPNTMPPPVPGTPVDPAEYAKHGILDHDANKDCVREGRPSEHVIWTMPPPAGPYIVRVDAPSLCGAPSVAWTALAFRAGELRASARGIATADDVLHPRGAGAGALALELTLP